MNVTDFKKKYKNKWVLAEVLKETKKHEIIEMAPIIVSDKRDDVYRSIGKLKKGAHVATFYTGQLPPKGLSFTFHVLRKI